MKNPQIVLKKISLVSILIGSGIVVEANLLKAEAASLTPEQIVSNWTKGPEVNYGQSSGNTQTVWAVDNTLLKVPFAAVTNFPKRIGQSSSADTERYGSLISDVVMTDNFYFSGSFMAPNDNDVIGLLWGYQDNNNHYRLSWGSNKVKRGNLGDGPYEGSDPLVQRGGLIITQEVNGQKTFLYTQSNLWWQRSVIYNFEIEQIDGSFTFNIMQGNQNIFSNTFSNTTFSSGKVGFNTAGVEVLYGNINLENIYRPIPDPSAVPEPITLLGAATAVSFGLFFKQKTK